MMMFASSFSSASSPLRSVASTAFLCRRWSSSRVASLYGVKVDWQTKFLDLQTKFVEKDEAWTKTLNKM